MRRLVLKLNLEAPLVSFSADTIYNDLHPTGFCPSKSQVIGMIGAAMGIKREEVERLNGLDQKYDIFIPEVSHSIPRIYEDFQVVSKRKTLSGRLAGSGLTISENDQFLAFSGKFASGKHGSKHTLTIRKQYLENLGSFIVYLLGSEEDLREAEQALKAPYYPLYIGRKCCIPSAPICNGIVEVELT